MAGMLVFALLLIAAIVPQERYKEARNTRRWEEVYSIVAAILLKEKDDGYVYYGEPAAPVDRDPTTAQVIVKNVKGLTCELWNRDAVACPGAETAGLSVSKTGADCVALLDDGKRNYEGLVKRYLSDLPVGPSGPGRGEDGRIYGHPLGAGNTGYYINRGSEGRIEVGACWPEQGVVISVAR